jgi:hypothetical protein
MQTNMRYVRCPPSSPRAPFSGAEWAQTPRSVQDFVLALDARVRMLDARISALTEQIESLPCCLDHTFDLFFSD